MGWPKGKKRGPSNLRGRHVLDIDPKQVQVILDDRETAPEIRFTTVMEMLLEAMCESTNANVEAVGVGLRRFWNTDMEKTIIWTPEVEE